jgi:hypothetical protein
MKQVELSKNKEVEAMYNKLGLNTLLPSHAKSRLLRLGDEVLNVYQYPEDYQRKHLINCSYCMSQSQVARVLSKPESSIRDFLNPRRGKTLLGNVSEPPNLPELSVEGSNKVIKPISLKATGLYWLQWAILGDAAAMRLVSALMERSLQDRAEEAFCARRKLPESISTPTPTPEIKLALEPMWTVVDEEIPAPPTSDEHKNQRENQKLKDKLALAEKQYQDLFNAYPVLVDDQGVKLYTFDFTVEEVRKMLELPTSEAARDLIYQVVRTKWKLGDWQLKTVNICSPTLTAREHSAILARACNQLLVDEEVEPQRKSDSDRTFDNPNDKQASENLLAAGYVM